LGAALHHLVQQTTLAGAARPPKTVWANVSNFYVKTAQGWRLAAHHASPGQPDQSASPADLPSTLH
jgi:ketosteroid isomerase-like protein